MVFDGYVAAGHVCLGASNRWSGSISKGLASQMVCLHGILKEESSGHGSSRQRHPAADSKQQSDDKGCLGFGSLKTILIIKRAMPYWPVRPLSNL